MRLLSSISISSEGTEAAVNRSEVRPLATIERESARRTAHIQRLQHGQMLGGEEREEGVHVALVQVVAYLAAPPQRYRRSPSSSAGRSGSATAAWSCSSPRRGRGPFHAPGRTPRRGTAGT